MKTHLVIYISCTLTELKNFVPFERAAEFTRYECTVEIHCETGKHLYVNCSPVGPTCWGWRYFRDEWVKRHGPI